MTLVFSMLRMRYLWDISVCVHHAAKHLGMEFRRGHSGDLQKATISFMWQLKPWESTGLDRKQGEQRREQEEKKTKQTTLRSKVRRKRKQQSVTKAN